MHEAPSLSEIQKFLNVTKTYNVAESYQAITDHAEQYRNIRTRIQELGKKVEAHKDQQNENPLTFSSIDDMLKKASDFFSTLGDTYYSDIQRVLRDPMITKNITLIKEGKSTGSVKVDSDNKIIITANITPDASGLMALCQELSNAHVLSHSVNQEKERDQKEEHLVEKTTNMFISTMIIDYLTKDSNLTPQEVDRLKYQSLKELEYDINMLSVDKAIFQLILDNNPEAFHSNLENYTPENFLTAIEKLEPYQLDAVYARIKDISEKGNTARYIQGEVAAELTGLALNNELHNHPNAKDKISEDLIESIKNTHILTEVGGKTPEQIVESGADLVNDNINQHLSNEQENDVVPELIRVKQEYNNNSNNTN